MKDVEIFEQVLINNKGKLAILRADPSVDKPKSLMDDAVSVYVNNHPYNEFIEIFLDNPWVRVIVGGINELDFVPFDEQKLHD